MGGYGEGTEFPGTHSWDFFRRLKRVASAVKMSIAVTLTCGAPSFGEGRCWILTCQLFRFLMRWPTIVECREMQYLHRQNVGEICIYCERTLPFRLLNLASGEGRGRGLRDSCL